MDWLQNPLDIAELSSSCPCQGAKCLGRCSAYGVCPVYTSSDTCRGLLLCFVHVLSTDECLYFFIMREGVFYGMVTESAGSRRSVIKCCMCNANLRCSKG